MEELKEYTNEVLYEHYRTEKLTQGGHSVEGTRGYVEGDFRISVPM
jgi:septin family protein